MKENTKNSKKEKRVLLGALCLAAVVAAGSTFAWFTSQDEVTNRLTAHGDYGVSITEDFTPPDDWVPGQTINKDVSAVNTGNISAFVKLELSGAFNLTVETADGEDVECGKSYVNATNTATVSGNGHILDVLSEDEVKSLQAGGYLAVAPKDIETGNVGTDFETTKEGLYLFRREIKDGDTTTYDYSGYYYSNLGIYCGLKTIVDENGSLTADVLRDKGETLTAEEIDSVKLKSYESKTIENKDVVWDYSKVSSDNLVTATYYPNGKDNPGAKDIKINIALDNIGDGTAADTWQYIEDTGFYYTDDVEPGETTEILVDSVTLDKDTKQEAFQTMDFDLTVKLNSVQVTKNEEGVETADAVSGFGTVNDGVENNPTVEKNEITVISWK